MNALPSTDRRVVVTGIGLVSCLGLTLDDVSGSLRKGRSGIGVDPERIRAGFRSPLTGVLPPLDAARATISKKLRKTMAEHVEYAYLATESAFESSGTPRDAFSDERSGIFIGNDSSAGAAREILDAVRRDGGTQLLGSGAVVRSMNSSPSINLGTIYRIKGGSLTVSAACASGAHAVGLGFLLIKLGWLDAAIVGGSQELCWESMAAFDALMTFSTRSDSPKETPRPFSKDRDGLVPGGGGAILFIEEAGRAAKRSAKVYGEIIGYAITSDGSHVTNPSSEGAERCMRLALAQAGLRSSDVDYINAHATGTVAGDLAEARAIYSVFGPDCPPVSSTKSMTGHECWMAGASEVAYSLLMMRDGFVAPNINFAGLSDDMPPIPVTAETREADLRIVLSNSFGFGGTNACILLKKFEG